MCVCVLIFIRISRFWDVTHLFLHYTCINCTNTPTQTQTAERSPTIQVALRDSNSHKSTVNLVSTEIIIKDKEMMRISEGSFHKTEERRAGQMEEAVCFVQLSTAFGSHSRRWLMQTWRCQILSFQHEKKSYIPQAAQTLLSDLCVATCWPLHPLCIKQRHVLSEVCTAQRTTL